MRYFEKAFDGAVDSLAQYCYHDILDTMNYINYCEKQNRLDRLGLKIKKVIFNDPATIILWTNGEKTVVKCSEGDEFDREKGLAMAICKEILGDKFKSTFKEFAPEEAKPVDPYHWIGFFVSDNGLKIGNLCINKGETSTIEAKK